MGSNVGWASFKRSRKMKKESHRTISHTFNEIAYDFDLVLHPRRPQTWDDPEEPEYFEIETVRDEIGNEIPDEFFNKMIDAGIEKEIEVYLD